MEVKEENLVSKNGVQYTKVTTEIKPEDGFVNQTIVSQGDSSYSYEKRMFKGKAKLVHYETDDPKITRPVTGIIGISLILVGIILLIIGNTGTIFFGIMLIITAVSFLFQSKKDIDRIEKEKYSDRK